MYAIRRDGGKDFRVTEKTKVCSRHFHSSNLRTSLNGRVYVKDNVVPSRFKWCPKSLRKRKAPAVRSPLQATTKTKPSTSAATCSSFDSMNESETIQKANADELEQGAENGMTEKLEKKMLSEDLKQKLLSMERKLLKAENWITALENERTLALLCEKLMAVEKKLECMTKRVFDIERFKCDENISFYTGFPLVWYFCSHLRISEPRYMYWRGKHQILLFFSFWTQYTWCVLQSVGRRQLRSRTMEQQAGETKKAQTFWGIFHGNVPPAQRVCFAASFPFIWSCNINCQPNLYCLG